MAKILIVEDNEFTRENLNEILELEGFETITANHGRQGIQLAQKYRPDLIICDVMMPELDGYGVLETLGKDERTACIPFIFLTAKSTQPDFRSGMNLGANDYLTKPFSPSDVVKAVTTQLRKQQAIISAYTAQIRQLEKGIVQVAHQDSLTQLPNQRVLTQQLQKLVNHPTPRSLLLISIDQFNFLESILDSVNQDRLVRIIAYRLQKIFSITGKLSTAGQVFHMNRGQFAILIDHSKTSVDILEIIESTFSYLRTPCMLNGQSMTLTISAGIASTAKIAAVLMHSSPMNRLMQDAAAALYQTQEQGGDSYTLYCREMTLQSSERLNIANALHYALEHSEFKILYQPQVNIKTGEIVGIEALLRWQSAQLGRVSPGKFIPIAEEIGLIDEIGNWVLWMACYQAKTWQKVMARPVSVSVNLSPTQLSQPGFIDAIRMILTKTKLPPSLLHLEITETALVKDQDCVICTLREIRKMGVRIAIDDFGTGYSGLGYLSYFPCHILKVDRLFIRNIHQHSTNQRIVAAILKMGHDLNLKIIAEGAETKTELNYLKQQGCDIVQGYVYSKPVEMSDVYSLIQQSAYH